MAGVKLEPTKRPVAAVSWYVLALAVVLLGASLAGAAPPPAERELLLFDEVVVSAAGKRLQVESDAPSWVSIVTQEDIRRFGVRTLGDALALVPGFYGTYDRNYEYVGVRGFLRPGDYNNRILLLVNGLTYNDDVYGSAPLGYDFGIDLEAIERIEVSRGPGSALYGGNAIFAVVNVVTFDGTTMPGVRPLAETGSDYRWRFQSTLGHRFASGPEVFVSGSYLSVDGPGKLYFPEFDTPETNGVAVDLDGESAGNFYMNARWGDLFLQGGVNRRDKSIPTGSYGTVFGVPGTSTLDGRQFAEVLYQTALRPDVQLTARGYYGGVTYRGRYRYENEDGSLYVNHDEATSNWFGGEVRGLWTLGDWNVLTVGAQYDDHPDVRQRNFDPGVPPYIDDSRSYTNWGVYLEDEVRIAAWLSVVAGARYDDYYDRIGEFSPRVGVILRPLQSTNLKLLYGRAFRPPSIYEQYYAGDGDPAQFANPHLDPETISTYEIDLEQGLWGEAHGTLALYHYELDDLIDPVQVEIDGVSGTKFENGPAASAYGLDVELRQPLPYHSLLRSSFSAQRVRSQGAQLSNSPSYLGKVELLFPVPLGPFDVDAGAELLVVSPRKTLAGGEVGTVNTLNLNLWYETPLPNLVLTLGLYNLLDQRFEDPGGVEHVQDAIAQDGLTFRTQVRYAF
ncbi:TonB-dependent receptor [Candidatus Binatia bacterium]|nr:TonB-dependent receptor [Candidatus Binatia bacterium]